MPRIICGFRPRRRILLFVEDRDELLWMGPLVVVYVVILISERMIAAEYSRIAYVACAVVIAAVGMYFASRTWRIAFCALALLAVLGPVYSARMAYATIHHATDAAIQDASDPLIEGQRPLILLASDLHFIGGPKGATREGTSWSDLPAQRLSDAVRRWKPLYFVLTGDITDSGQEKEWAQAREILFTSAERAGSVPLIAPGNHDLQPSLIRSRSPAYVLPQMYPGALQLRRYVSTAAELTPSTFAPDQRAIGVLKNDYRVLEPISVTEYEACVQMQMAMREPPYRGSAGLEYCAQQLHQRAEPANGDRRAYEMWFPLVYDAPIATTRFVIMNSSNDLTFDIARNGIGAFGTRQLEALTHILEAWPGDRKRLILLLHHPVARSVLESECGDCLASWKAFTNSSLYNYFFLRGNTEETRQLISRLGEFAEDRPDVSVTVLTGHRHRRYQGRLRERFDVIEAPAPHELPGAWLLFEKQRGSELEARYLKLG